MLVSYTGASTNCHIRFVLNKSVREQSILKPLLPRKRARFRRNNMKLARFGKNNIKRARFGRNNIILVKFGKNNIALLRSSLFFQYDQT